MLSSQLALYGLEALRDGDPYITTLIRQAPIIEAIKSYKIWEDAVKYAEEQSNVSEGKKEIVAIHILFVNLEQNTINEFFSIDDLNSITVSALFCFSPNDSENTIVKTNVALLLF